MLAKEAIQNMNEADLRTKVLIPLLKAMGYQDVFEYHGGAGEQGKDIVCWKANDLNVRQNFALVVKAQPVTGKAKIAQGTAGEVQMQITQCFGHPYSDPKTGHSQDVNQCWVVSNHEITKEAIEAINSAISATKLDRLTTYVDGDTLWGLVQQYLPFQTVWQTLEDAGKILNSIDSHYRLQAKVSGHTVEIGVSEKYPGAAQDKPFEIHATFAFPDTPEGRAKKEELARAFATGAPADIPAEFVRSIEFPDFIRPLIGSSDLGSGSLSLSPVASGPRVIMNVEFHHDSGGGFVLENMPFRAIQAGEKEITLESDEHPIPVKIKLTLRPGDGNATVNFHFGELPLNVAQVLEILKLKKFMSIPFSIHCVHAAMQLPLFAMQHPNGLFEEPEARFMDVISDLAQIQLRVKRPITIPNRDFTDEEMQTIGRLIAILHTGRLEARWTGFSFSTLPDATKNVLEVFGDGKAGAVMVEREEAEELFGMLMPLGIVRVICSQAKLANEAEVRDQYARATDDKTAMRLEFVPGDDSEVVKEYLSWLPNSAS